MGNLLRQIKKNNDALEAQLPEKALQFASKLYLEIYSAKAKEPYMEMIRKEWLEAVLARIDSGGQLDEAFYKAQRKEREAYVELAPRKSFLEVVTEYGTIFFMSVLLLFILEGITAGIWSRYLQGDFTTKISLGFFIACVLITGLCMVIYHLLMTHAFDLQTKRNLPKSVFVGGFILVFFIVLVGQYTLQGIVLFEVNGLITGVVLFVMGLICKWVERVQMNDVIQNIKV